MIKRIMFDLDNTLIPCLDDNYSATKEVFDYFNIPFNEDKYVLFKSAMLNYEKHHKRFNKEDMSRYFKNILNKKIPNTFVNIWIEYLSKMVPDKDEKLIELLKYLSSKYSLVVVSNWFRDQQVKKMKLYGIYEYFDEVITCEEYNKKPSREIFNKACEGYDKSEVIMVGDTFKTDIKGAMDFGLYSYYLTKIDRRRGKKFKVISNIYELREYL